MQSATIFFALAAVVAAVSGSGVGLVNDIHAYPAYKYSYGVSDKVTGDQKSASEVRDGGVVKGQYSLVQPDGVVRTVVYTSSPGRGFEAQVLNNGVAGHPAIYGRGAGLGGVGVGAGLVAGGAGLGLGARGLGLGGVGAGLAGPVGVGYGIGAPGVGLGGLGGAGLGYGVGAGIGGARSVVGGGLGLGLGGGAVGGGLGYGYGVGAGVGGAGIIG